MSLRSVVLAIGLAVSAATGPIRAEAASSEDPVLEGLLGEALARNPQLQAARQFERAAKERPAQAGAHPGPTVGVFYQNDGVAPSLGREPMTMLGVTAGQEILYRGKLGMRREVAQADAGLAGFDVERTR